VDLGLRDRSVIVAGASRGIGRAIALAFAEEGSHLAICARNEGPLQATAGELRERGVKVCARTADVSQAQSLDRFLEEAREELGRVDVLVNNASALQPADDEASWEASFQVDLMATVRACRKVVPWLEDAGGGSIIHISSTAALEAGAAPAYSALKAALLSHSKNLAITLAPKNIRVNTVAPGSIEFPGGLWEAIARDEPQQYEQIRASIPFGRLGTPEEVANAVVFLASERGSWITGACLPVDGGQHKGNL